MTALAEILLRNGSRLTGSDVEEQFMTDSVLKKLGIEVKRFDADNVAGKDAIIRSNAYQDNHIEAAAAKSLSVPVFSYPDIVAELFNSVYGIAVAGSHGKTTTTAMLAHVLKLADKNLTAIVGSKVIDWGSGAQAGDLSLPDSLFVLEADEYKEAFLNYRPRAAIILNIDYDHPDYFTDASHYRDAFLKFIALLPEDGFLVINGGDRQLCELAKEAKCKVIAVNPNDILSMNLLCRGEHNLLNANLAYQTAIALGVPPESARNSLENFRGTARRQQFIGEAGGLLIFDDYAHHPTEIKATLKALKQSHGDRKIIAIFQPHTYSRTKALFSEFASAFSDADAVILSDVYASAREQKQGDNIGVDMEAMADILRSQNKEAIFIKNKDDIANYIKNGSDIKNSLLVTMGAGDIWQVADELVNSVNS